MYVYLVCVWRADTPIFMFCRSCWHKLVNPVCCIYRKFRGSAGTPVLPISLEVPTTFILNYCVILLMGQGLESSENSSFYICHIEYIEPIYFPASLITVYLWVFLFFFFVIFRFVVVSPHFNFGSPDYFRLLTNTASFFSNKFSRFLWIEYKNKKPRNVIRNIGGDTSICRYR